MAIGIYSCGLQYNVNNFLPYFSALHFFVKDQSDRKMKDGKIGEICV